MEETGGQLQMDGMCPVITSQSASCNDVLWHRVVVESVLVLLILRGGELADCFNGTLSSSLASGYEAHRSIPRAGGLIQGVSDTAENARVSDKDLTS